MTGLDLTGLDLARSPDLQNSFFYYRAGVPKAWGGDYVYAGNEFCNDNFLAPDHPRTLNPRKYSSPGGPFSNGWSNVVLGCREGSQN